MAVSLSPSVPLTQRVQIGDEVLDYFEYLLPEGYMRQGLELAERMPVSIDSTLATLSAEAHAGTDQSLLERLQQRLLNKCRKLPAHWAAG